MDFWLFALNKMVDSHSLSPSTGQAYGLQNCRLTPKSFGHDPTYNQGESIRPTYVFFRVLMLNLQQTLVELAPRLDVLLLVGCTVMEYITM